ncbi:MAG: PEP-CTERM sorting domain-containing protein [Fimbriimonadia bacterium]|nr:PEP-CTERM sorting domain-containing protein [Fimbriimonadia bacterium]
MRITSLNQSYPFVWSEREGFRYLTPQGGYTQNPNEAITGRVWGMSGSGVVVGSSGNLAFRWKSGQGVQYLSPPPGAPSAWAYSASWDGSIAVGSSTIGALIWDTNRTPRVIVQGTARGVSADGRVVVGGLLGDAGSGMFRWTEETGLQRLAWGGSARATSADGSVIVGNGLVSEGSGAIRWTAETGAHLIAPSHLGGWGRAVSANGRVVVGEVHIGPQRAFRWTESGGFELLGETYRSILPSGVRLHQASGVSGNGRYIVGSADTRDGTKYYLLDTVPEPSGLLALGLGLGLLWKQRKQIGLSTKK